MSDQSSWGVGRRPRLRRLLVLGLALLALLVVVGGGSLLQPQQTAAPPTRVPSVGRTSSICTVPSATTGSASGTQGDDQPRATTSVTAVTTRQDPGREGTLTGSALDSEESQLEVTQQGHGAQIVSAKASVLLEGIGVMATASSGVVFSAATSGIDAGLTAAPCLPPGTQHWFTGIGTGDADRTELILSNPDDAQAEVDLRYYGRLGRVVVAGGQGIVVEAHASRTVSLSGVTATDGPFSVEIQASEGRVSAVGRRARTDNLKPAGVDWQLPATGPATAVVVPSIPEDEGTRELVVANPGTDRATVQVQILGLQGPLAPAGAETLEVAPESTASVDLAPGLLGEAGAVKLTSDQPVTASVVSTSKRAAATPDFAVQSAAPPLVRTGVSALATTNAGSTELVLSNSADTDTQVSFEVFNLDGVSLRTDDVLIAANSTATRRITSQAPSYLAVKVPDGSSVVGGLVLTQRDGGAAGLATIPLTSPDLASRAPSTVPDPSVGR
ncbi:MAG TPA: DUF5719 family protein [Propionibacteriaceae bacterium]